MNSQRSREGYLLIDHRYSPGLGPHGTQRGADTVIEAPTYTCSHCQRVVILNPSRTRERAYCPKCSHLICDECEAARIAAGWACRSFNEIADEIMEASVAKGVI